MVVLFEQGLMFMLRVDVDKHLAQSFQVSHGAGRAVDEAAGTTISAECAP